MIKSLNYQQFLAQPEKLKLLPGYLIISEDSYQADKTYQAVRQLVKKHFPNFETVILYGDELKSNILSEYLDSYSIFSDNRLLVIRNASRLGEGDIPRMQTEKQRRSLDIVAEYFSNPEPTQVVVIMAETVDKRMTAWKKIREVCQTIECEPIRYAGHMKAWLEEALRFNQKIMANDAKTLFLEKVELDFYTAENELEKLLIYTAGRKNISKEDVFTTLPTSRSGTMSDFYNVLGNKDTGQLIRKVNMMLENEWVDLQILSVIFRFFFILWKIQALRAKHITPGEISAKHLNELFESQRKDYLTYAEKFSPQALENVFKIIMETDLSIKLSKAESKLLLTLCITKICHES